MTLAPSEKWRIEVDSNLINELRMAHGWTWTELVAKLGIQEDTLYAVRHKGYASFAVLAKLATVFQIEPGELIVWFPVPQDYPDRAPLGYGRRPVKRRKDYMRKAPRSHKPWSFSEVENLVSLRAAGFTWKEIAARLSRTVGGVKDKWFTITETERKQDRAKTTETN